MDPIDNIQIYELSKALTTKEAAQEILANFLLLVSQHEVDLKKLDHRSQHVISKSLLPHDFKDWIPLEATGDGNCLYNAVSISLSGDESLAGLLRLLTVAELFANSEFYAHHPQLAAISEDSNYSVPALLNIFMSDQKAQDKYGGNIDNASHAIEVLAQESAKPFVYSSQFHILALASVIGKPIQSVYPDIPSCSAIKKALHGVFYPREAPFTVDSDSHLVCVMWTSLGRSQLHGWRPNHFVPLVNKPSGFVAATSYADAVRYGRGIIPPKAYKTSHFQTSSKRQYDVPYVKSGVKSKRPIKPKGKLSSSHTKSICAIPTSRPQTVCKEDEQPFSQNLQSVKESGSNEPPKKTSVTSAKAPSAKAPSSTSA